MQTINEINTVSYSDLKPYSIKESRVFNALKSRSCFKLNFGTSYTSYTEIEAYSEIFAEAGAHLINVPADFEIIQAVRNGLDRVVRKPGDQQPNIMVSLSLDEQMNPRNKRVLLDNLLTNQSVNIKPKTKMSLTSENLSQMWSLGVTYLEIHVGENFDWLESYIRKIHELSPHPWVISVSLSGQTASFNELTEQTKRIHQLLGDGALIQLDGTPISSNTTDAYYHNANNNDISILRALASTSAVLAADRSVFVQISGGMNDTIVPLLSRFGVRVNGVSMGAYPKQLISSHLDNKETAVAIASKLVNNIQSQ